MQSTPILEAEQTARKGGLMRQRVRLQAPKAQKEKDMERELKERIREKLAQNTIFSKQTQVMRIEQIRKLLVDLSMTDLISTEEMLAIWDMVIKHMQEQGLMEEYFIKYCDDENE